MRSKRIPAEEQYCLIMECRQSGLTDHQWCVEHDIKPGTNNTKWDRSSASGSNASHCEGVGMLGDITAADEIYIVTGRTDMQKSIDGLCAIVEDQLHIDLRRSALYLFCGKRCDRIKALLWESDGFVLLYKRMEVQGRFRWPRNQLEVKQRVSH